MRSIFILAMLMFSCLLSGFLVRPAFAEVKFIKNNDKDMARAFAKAKKTLDTFLKTAQKPAKDEKNFVVKIFLKDKNGSEYIWVGPFQPEGNKFVGILMNKPAFVKNAEYGKRVYFTKSQIRDWSYKKKGKILGHFTTCVLLAKMPKREAAQYRKMGFTCLVN